MSARGDLIGDAVADALNSPPLDVSTGTLEERKHRIWRAICNALALSFDPIWIDLYVNPTEVACYSTGTTPWPTKTIAWQLEIWESDQEIPVAIWCKNGTGVYDWSLIWPVTGIGSPPTSDTGSSLYTALVPDPLNRGEVVCVFGLEGCGGYLPFVGWTEIIPGVMQRDATGPLTYAWFDGVDPDTHNASGTSSFLNSLVILPPSSELGTADKKAHGVWRVKDVGGHYEGAVYVATHARLERDLNYNTDGDFVQYMTFLVARGSNFGGQYATLQDATVDLGTTEQNWTFSGTHSWADSYELLSAAELVTRGASTTATDMSATATNETVAMSPVFSTPLGSPAIAVFPAGKNDFHLQDVILSGDAGDGVNTIRVSLYAWDRVEALGTLLCQATTEPIDWSSLYSQSSRDLVCQGTLDEDYAFPPDYGLQLIFEFITTSTTPVSVSFTYNSSLRGTHVVTTFDVPGFGTTDHRLLTNKNDRVGGVGQHEDTTVDLSGFDGFTGNLTGVSTLDGAMTVLDGLPTVGRPPYASGTFAGGVITIPDRAWTSEVTLSPGDTVSGIATSGWQNGDRVTLIVYGAQLGEEGQIILQHNGSPGAGASPLLNNSLAMMGEEYNDINLMTRAVVEYVYLTSLGAWQLCGVSA